jgi:protocatechuate 3,4-dioxygenase beta subunit
MLAGMKSIAPHSLAAACTPRREFLRQLFVKGEPGNELDGIYRRVGDAQARASVTVDFVPLPDSRIGEVAARFDIVLAAGSAN